IWGLWASSPVSNHFAIKKKPKCPCAGAGRFYPLAWPLTAPALRIYVPIRKAQVTKCSLGRKNPGTAQGLDFHASCARPTFC
ncbi:hypothetical protein HAX54_015555, partial [Datura stramonium]|nr:hypothetical protein [Datura stramonium]